MARRLIERCAARTTVAALVLHLSLLGARPAAAQNDDALAKQYYKLGEELYNRADYEGALKQFSQSYQLSKRPALLYNMARCHESLGQHEKAIEIYGEYLKANPDNPAMIQARIDNLKRLIEKKRKESTPPPPGPTPTPEPAPVAPADGSRPLRWPGWITLGAGGALLVTGLALGLRAKVKEGEVEEANQKGTEYLEVKSAEDAGRTLAKASIALSIVGGVAAATGAVLLILDARRPSSERRAWFAPTLTAGGFAVTGGLRF